VKPKEHVCVAHVTVRTSVNGGPWSGPLRVTVRDGDEIKIVQPVEVTFEPRVPFKEGKK
jgi:hypothetical protein